MQTVNSTLMNSSYHLVSGKVISGQEEAVSGWMAGNYLADQLQHKVRLNTTCRDCTYIHRLGEDLLPLVHTIRDRPVVLTWNRAFAFCFKFYQLYAFLCYWPIIMYIHTYYYISPLLSLLGQSSQWITRSRRSIGRDCLLGPRSEGQPRQSLSHQCLSLRQKLYSLC